MTVEQAKQAFAAVELRERFILKLAVLAGTRCSEIFGLRRGRIKGDHLDIVERVCKRGIDTPKTQKQRDKQHCPAVSVLISNSGSAFRRIRGRKDGCSDPNGWRLLLVPTTWWSGTSVPN
jgi:hypothetical protein